MARKGVSDENHSGTNSHDKERERERGKRRAGELESGRAGESERERDGELTPLHHLVICKTEKPSFAKKKDLLPNNPMDQTNLKSLQGQRKVATQGVSSENHHGLREEGVDGWREEVNLAN